MKTIASLVTELNERNFAKLNGEVVGVNIKVILLNMPLSAYRLHDRTTEAEALRALCVDCVTLLALVRHDKHVSVRAADVPNTEVLFAKHAILEHVAVMCHMAGRHMLNGTDTAVFAQCVADNVLIIITYLEHLLKVTTKHDRFLSVVNSEIPKIMQG